MSRKPAREPATAYDYRRALLLVQMIARGFVSHKHLRDLCDDWHVDYEDGYTRDELLHALAVHAVKIGRENSAK